MELEPHESTTKGVNYAPTSQTAVSSAPMRFRVEATVMGQRIDLVGPMAVCGSGCRRLDFRAIDAGSEDGHMQLQTLGVDTGVASDVVIVRFAKFGEARLPDNTLIRWLVVMEDGDTLQGPMIAPTLSNGTVDFPGHLRLGGRMVVTVQVGETEPMRLRSRTEPVLSGDIAGWPPYGASLRLENGPIEYFLEDDVENAQANPVVQVTANTVVLGTQPHPILSRAPEIIRAERGPGGVELQWTSTADEIETTPPITAYHVYRNATPHDVAGYELAEVVAAPSTTWTDTQPPSGAVSYLVVHAARCPFNYDLEGLLGNPALVAPLS